MSLIVGLNSSGNQINNKVIASNVTGDVYDTFPVSNTGTSTGNYNHLGIDGQNNNKWDLLNVSGDLDGGFNLWHSSSTHAPLLIASVDDTGLTIDRSTSGTPPLLSPPILSIPDGSHINFSADLTQPPYNMVYQDLSANPVYMTQTNSFYTTGELVYAFVTSPTQVQLFKNDPNTNPIPPNTVPSGFPTTNTTGLVIGQPVFAFSLPSPTITKSSVLTGDTLSFNATSFSPTVLNQTGLTITDDNNNSNTVSYNQSVIRNSSNGSSTLSSNAIQINNGVGSYTTLASSVAYFNNNGVNTIAIDNSPQMVLNDTSQTSQAIIDYSRIIFSEVNGLQGTLSRNGLTINAPNGAYMSLTPSVLNYYNGTIITTSLRGAESYLSFNDGTNNSQLTTTDILFNSVSLKSTVSTNTSNIATNTASITALQQNTIQAPIIQLCSPAVFGTSPSLPPQKMFISSNASNISNIGYGGWYFRNWITGVNIGWNAAFASTTSTVGDLLQLSFSFLTTNTTSSPQLSVYTSPPTGGNFYNSRRSYVNTGTPTANTPYLYYINFNGYTGVPFKSGHTPVLMTNTGVSNVGAFASTEILYFWSVGTNSIAAANSVELIISGMTFKMNHNSDGIVTQPYLFLNGEVINAAPVVAQGAGTLTINPYHYGCSFGCTGDVTVSTGSLRAQDVLFYITLVNAKSTGAVGITYIGSAGSTSYILQQSGTQVSLSWSGTYWTIL